MTQQAKVIDEYYTVLTDIGSSAAMRGETREGHFTTIASAVEHAMRVTLDRAVSCRVLRITVHEPVEVESMFGTKLLTEKVTGSVDIPGPRSYNHEPQLSRYHPVNGWVIPEFVAVESDSL